MAQQPDSPDAGADEHTRFVAQLAKRFRVSLLRYLTDLLSRREDAEDVVQETYVRLLNAKALEHTDERARAFMFKVATNLAYDRFRQRRAHGRHSPDDLAELASDAPTPEGIVGFEQGLTIVKRTLLELEPRCRRVFLLRATAELSYDEIAERLGVSKRTVEREMQHALELCQRRLQRDHRE